MGGSVSGPRKPVGLEELGFLLGAPPRSAVTRQEARLGGTNLALPSAPSSSSPLILLRLVDPDRVASFQACDPAPPG